MEKMGNPNLAKARVVCLPIPELKLGAIEIPLFQTYSYLNISIQ